MLDLETINQFKQLDLEDLSPYNDIITTALKEIEMRKRKEILSNHKFAIKQIVEHDKKGGEVIRWRTCLPNPDGTQGKQVKRKSLKDLEDIIIEFYKNKDKQCPTFKEVYLEWREYHWKLNNSTEGTKDKYITDYVRFIKGKSIEYKSIDKITDIQLEQFFLNAIIENNLTYNTFGKLFGYINNTFRYAFKHRIIKTNQMDYLNKSDFKHACTPKQIKTAETELLTDEQFDLLLEQIYKDIEKYPTNFTFYAVELAAKTGMRVGEVATLRWEDINYDKGYIRICRSDKYHKTRNKNDKIIKGEWVIEQTKTKTPRVFPLDDYIIESLNRIKSAQKKYNMESEWLFPHPKYGWTHSLMIASCCKNKGKQLGFEHPISIHSLRKTLNTDLRNNNVPVKICASLFGHSEKVNTEYYYYDTFSIMQKQEAIEKMHNKRLCTV